MFAFLLASLRPAFPTSKIVRNENPPPFPSIFMKKNYSAFDIDD